MRYLLILVLFLPNLIFGQDTLNKTTQEKIYDFPEVGPIFPGGAKAMNEWIANEVEYPSAAISNGEQGVVYVKFVIGIDGVVRDVKVVKGVSSTLDAEAARVIKNMSNWTPATQAGKNVASNFTMPISFIIQSSKRSKKTQPKKVIKNRID